MVLHIWKKWEHRSIGLWYSFNIIRQKIFATINRARNVTTTVCGCCERLNADTTSNTTHTTMHCTYPGIKPPSATRSYTCRGFSKYWNFRISLHAQNIHRNQRSCNFNRQSDNDNGVKNSAIALSPMNFSGYIGHATSWMLTTYYMLFSRRVMVMVIRGFSV